MNWFWSFWIEGENEITHLDELCPWVIIPREENSINMQFNDIEREVIFLRASKELIDNMVNYEVLRIVGSDPNSEIRFESTTHQKFFNIILVDFLSNTDKRILGEETSFLAALQSICAAPKFDQNNSVNDLLRVTQDFENWLQTEVLVEKVWLPSINLEIDLKIKRVEFIKICGNISKHNFSRLGSVSKQIIEIFSRNNHVLSQEESVIIISEFYEWFHTDIFVYHSSTIADFLNKIRWGIYDYLNPEFRKSIVFTSEEHPYMYEFTYPNGVNDSFAKYCYWDLMNEIRSKPYMNKFQVSHYLKNKF